MKIGRGCRMARNESKTVLRSWRKVPMAEAQVRLGVGSDSGWDGIGCKNQKTEAFDSCSQKSRIYLQDKGKPLKCVQGRETIWEECSLWAWGMNSSLMQAGDQGTSDLLQWYQWAMSVLWISILTTRRKMDEFRENLEIGSIIDWLLGRGR